MGSLEKKETLQKIICSFQRLKGLVDLASDEALDTLAKILLSLGLCIGLYHIVLRCSHKVRRQLSMTVG